MAPAGSPAPVPISETAIAPDPAPGGLANFDAALVRRCLSAITKTVAGFLGGKVYKKALKKTGDSKFAKQMSDGCAPTPDEIDALAELSEICLRKYGVGTEYAPEIGLGAIAANIGLRYVSAMRELETYPDKETNA